jgi:CubicO group peptidase (beta-lactamase class C family)
MRPLQTAPAIFALCSMAIAVACEAATVSQQLDTYLQAQVDRNHFSGTVLVAQDGKVLLAQGYGYANAEWRTPNTLQTKFRLGSLTKQFTATAIMRLREKGLLRLEDSICKYVEPCVESWKPVTLHHLLVTGKPYSQVLRELIFDPLEMHDSGYDQSATILTHRAAGYRLVNGRLENAEYIDMAGPYAAGGLYSTAADLYKWDQALYSHLILPRSALKLMWTEVMSNYGYGWMVSTPESASQPPWALPDRFQIVHAGSINGFTAEILRFPNEHVTVIVLANLQDAHVVGPQLAAIVLRYKITLNER